MRIYELERGVIKGLSYFLSGDGIPGVSSERGGTVGDLVKKRGRLSRGVDLF